MTQHYIGTKLTIGTAMTRLAYNEYRGWTLPADENGADDGYLVEYLDGGQANHPDHKGYISWSPKAVHEGAYLAMGYVGHLAPHQLRVVGEKVELDDRLTKLTAFLDTDRFKALDQPERHRLEYQANLMTSLSHVLTDRIAEFPQPEQTYLQQDQGLEPVEYFALDDVAKLTEAERLGVFGYDPITEGSNKA